jgi:hypothetical protein
MFKLRDPSSDVEENSTHQFPTVGNNNTADKQTSGVGAMLHPLHGNTVSDHAETLHF